MRDPQPRSMDRRGFLRLGIATAVALGATGLAACDNAGAKGPESTPSASAPATPGPEASTSSPEQVKPTFELDVTKSEIYNGLSEKDRAAVDKAIKRDYDTKDDNDFLHVDPEVRALVGIIYAQANREAYVQYVLATQNNDPASYPSSPEELRESFDYNFEAILKADPKKMGSDVAPATESVSIRIDAAFLIAFGAHSLADDDPKKAAAVEAAKKTLASAFKFNSDTIPENYSAPQREIYEGLLKDLESVFTTGDKESMYSISTSDPDELLLPGGDAGKSFAKFRTEYGAGKWMYGFSVVGSQSRGGNDYIGYWTDAKPVELTNGTDVYPWYIEKLQNRGDGTI